MLRIYFLQQWFGLSDPMMEESLYHTTSLSQFAKLSLSQGSIPDETTILNFRHLIEKHELAQKFLEQINQDLQSKGLLLRQGTIVDATIIHAPTSTKNASKSRCCRQCNNDPLAAIET